MGAALWLLWVVIAILTLAGELLTLGLFFASLSVAALVTAAASLVLPLPGQVLIFCVVSLLMLFAVRPLARRFLPFGSAGGEAPAIGPVGHRALATEPISSLQGQIRIGSGQFWSARPEQPDASIDPGKEVEVVRMDGLTAVVRPVNVPDRLAEDVSRGATPFGLSVREVEVLQLLGLGLSNADIAERLVLSERTVDHHVSHILNKTGASSRLEAVRLGLDVGVVRLDRDSKAE
jgi:membrane protein implicated in regulation of membrane protease activity/DNA-binding CsgD family transcriptional regulator